MTLGEDLLDENDRKRAARKRRLTFLILIVGYIAAMALLIWKWA